LIQPLLVGSALTVTGGEDVEITATVEVTERYPPETGCEPGFWNVREAAGAVIP
jgi:hypothetical protein